jgi:hypothetical protein
MDREEEEKDSYLSVHISYHIFFALFPYVCKVRRVYILETYSILTTCMLG